MTSNTEKASSSLASAEADEKALQNELHGEDGFNYITGWTLHLITIGMALSTFLVNLEITIVSTSLVSITNELHDFGGSSWIVTAYLITYTGGLVIWAKLSDLLGRKPIFVASLTIFCAFSGGCGAAQTMNQLIVCRAFQGIGGGGIYALIMVMLYELVPPPRYPLYAALLTIMVASSFALGPIFGGLILQRASWRWVFLLNVPAAALAAGIILVAVPRDFPNQGKTRTQIPLRGLAVADITGSVLMVSALALLIVAFEEAAINLSWAIPTFIGPLCASVITLVAFLASQRYASRPSSIVEPVLPWRFCQSRLIMGLLSSSFMTGAVSITCIIQIPIRYQTAIGGSPLQAGIRVIPIAVSAPLGTMITAILLKNRRVPPLYLSLVGQLLQIVGLVFLSQGSPNDPDWPGLYGIEVIIGLGMGCNIGTAALLTPWTVEKRDIAVGSAAVTQFRFLGSAIVVAIITAVGNSWVKNALLERLTPLQVSTIFRSTEAISDLPEDAEVFVRSIFIQSFNLQMRIVLGFSVAGMFTWLLMWQKTQIRVP
ncbi:major facilitator superfamily domain-containing protein [Biscogniauxia mediterranea]|nr:major facilitator superfamily domain-containing protein [Biscogniauxia mediterranea]